MKKLLILLSILTISESAAPTTIAANPYPEKEILIRNKREKNEAWRLSDKILNVPKVKQTQEYWCGPAVGQSILQYFGLTNISPMQQHINESNSFQSSLAYRMSTEFRSGTTPNNFVNALNNIIVQYNLNSQRLYSINTINYNYSINNFVNIIRNSLQIIHR